MGYKTYIARSIVVILLCYASCSIICKAEEKVVRQTDEHIIKASKLCHAQDMKGLNQFAEQLISDFSNQKGEDPGRITRSVCTVIANSRFLEKNRGVKENILRRLALFALEREAPNEFRIKFDILLYYMHTDYFFSQGSNVWPVIRQQNANAWLTVWKSMEKEIDIQWNPAISAQIQFYPSNIVYFSRMTPASITNPLIRSEYERVIESNRIVSEKNEYQNDLRAVKKEYRPIIEDHIVKLYSRKPYNMMELEQMLEGVQDHSLIEIILKRVKIKQN